MNNIKIFENDEFGQVRTVMIDGEPWFVGKDVAKALNYNEPHKAVVKHVFGEDRTKYPTLTGGGTQEMWIINESGLYSLIFGSKLESAKKFKHWVTAEVLPAIRKTGTYAINIPRTDHPGEVANYLKAMDRRMEKEGIAPHKIAEAFKMVSEQYGIQLPDFFVKEPEYEQMKFTL